MSIWYANGNTKGALRSIRAITEHHRGARLPGDAVLGKLPEDAGLDGCREEAWHIFLGANNGATATTLAVLTSCIL